MFTASRKPGGYGSYGRGTAAVGSDLDLLLILRHCDEPIWNRLRRWDTSSLPLACDLLVYSLTEWRSLPEWNPRLAQALRNDTRWLGDPPEIIASLDQQQSSASPHKRPYRLYSGT